MPTQQPEPTTTERYAAWLAGLTWQQVPTSARHGATRDIIDALGLIVASRREPYCQQVAKGWDATGACSVPGMQQAFDMAGAALINGLAIHGEDFDDTLEGSPIRAGAMVIPAAFATAERHGLPGAQALLGVVAGLETICRLNQVAPGAIHKNGFHPVGVIGALGACAAAGVTLGLNARQMTNALGIAGSFSSGLLEYLTAGAWTKRLHPGWAAQSGVKAAMIAQQGFIGPHTVLEGPKGFFAAFAHGATDFNFAALFDRLGEHWHLNHIAFKPYACGTMIHPYIDCAIRLAQSGIQGGDIVDIECDTAEGLVDRLWAPLAAKHKPPSGYAAKFSMPFCMAVAFYDQRAGLAQFTDERAADPKVLDLARKIRYRLDPLNDYPVNYSGHMRVKLQNGETRCLRQAHFRGGRLEPLGDAELEKKFRDNCQYGGMSLARAEDLLSFAQTLSAQATFSLTNFRLL